MPKTRTGKNKTPFDEDVLIVDDRPDTVAETQARLSIAGWSSDLADEFEIAETKLRGIRYGLLILDWRVPKPEQPLGFNGGELLARNLKQGEYGPLNRRIPFLVLTAQYQSVKTDVLSQYEGYLGTFMKSSRVLDQEVFPLVSNELHRLTAECDTITHPAEEFSIAHGLASSIDTAKNLARDTMHSAFAIAVDLISDPEYDDHRMICFTINTVDSVDRVAELDEALYARLFESVPPEHRVLFAFNYVFE